MSRSNNFLDLGPSYLRSHVSYAWQDPSPVERGLLNRNLLEEAQRRYVPGVAGHRLRGQYNGTGRIFTSPAKGRMGSGDGQGYLASARPSGVPDVADPCLSEGLYGRSMRVQSATPTMGSNALGMRNGVFQGGKKSTVEPQTAQRPHTACTPAVERHLRRYTRCMSAGNSGQQRSPDVFSCAERPTGRLGSLSAAGELTGRPETPVSGVMPQGVVGAWGRHVGGAASDAIERRPGRCKSTEPSLLGKLTSGLENSAEAGDNMTAIVKSGVRTKIKAAVDCWWDEQHLASSSSQRNASSIGTGGMRRASLQRSHSAGQRKAYAGGSKSGKVGDRVKGSSSINNRTNRSRSSTVTSQGRKSLSKGGKSCGSFSSSSRQHNVVSYTDYVESGAGAESDGPQSATSQSKPTNSLMLISKLALPDTATSYLGLGKFSLSSGKAGLQEDSVHSRSEVATPTEVAESAVPSAVPSAECSIDESKVAVECTLGADPVQQMDFQTGAKLQALQLDNFEAEGNQSQVILALQDMTCRASIEFGITGEWFAEFCEQLVDEWESEAEDEDVSDA